MHSSYSSSSSATAAISAVRRPVRTPAVARYNDSKDAAVLRASGAGLRHFIHLDDFTKEELWHMLKVGRALKAKDGEPEAAGYQPVARRTMAMVFAKPSMRTRVSFETGFYKLGGHAVYLGPSEVGVGKREAVKDVARVLGRYNQIIMARLFDHQDMLEMARQSPVPVINGLTDYNHPCQLMADALTIWETLGRLEGVRVVYVGDGNNMVHSWAKLAGVMGINFVCCCPPGFTPDAATMQRAREAAEAQGCTVEVSHAAPADVVRGADVVYTDVWASMGQKDEFDERFKKFQGYQVTREVMESAGPQAIFMHCLPAERGVECTDEVIESPASVVFQEAENRMWAQNAVILHCLGLDTPHAGFPYPID